MSLLQKSHFLLNIPQKNMTQSKTEAERQEKKIWEILHAHICSCYLKNEKCRRRLQSEDIRIHESYCSFQKLAGINDILCYYLRGSSRSNQPMEGNNGHLNKLYRRCGRGRRTFDRWLEWAKSVEHEPCAFEKLINMTIMQKSIKAA